MWYEGAHLVTAYCRYLQKPSTSSLLTRRISPTQHKADGLSKSKYKQELQQVYFHRQCSFWNLSISESVTASSPVYRVCGYCKAPRNTEGEKASSVPKGKWHWILLQISGIYKGQQSPCTHGTGTGLCKPSPLLRAAVQCCSLKEAQGIRQGKAL